MLVKNKLKKINKMRRLITPEVTDDASSRIVDFNNLKALMLKHLDCNIFTDHTDERKRLQRQVEAGAALTGPDGIRKQLAAIDLGFFGRIYLPHYFSRPSPEFHRELDELWCDGVLKGLNPLHEPKMINAHEGSHTAVAAPRGHAKSTNLTFKDTLHAVVYQYKHYAILLSDTRDQATGFLDAIKEELFGETVQKVEIYYKMIVYVELPAMSQTEKESYMKCFGQNEQGRSA